MELSELFLTREDIPIAKGYPASFIVPIHPEIWKLPKEVRGNTKIGWDVFSQTKEMYFEDLENYKKHEDEATREWIDRHFLGPDEPKIMRFHGAYCPDPNREDALVSFDINADTHIYVEEDFSLYPTNLIGEKMKEYCNNKERFHHEISGDFKKPGKDYLRDYVIEGDRFYIDKRTPWVKIFDITDGKIHFYHGIGDAYVTHNVDTFPQAFLLRDWAICYLNKLLEMRKK
jgi:hypothetical protein